MYVTYVLIKYKNNETVQLCAVKIALKKKSKEITNLLLMLNLCGSNSL